MKVGIVGLGLIGGSLAKAYSRSGAQVYGCDLDEVVLGFARLSGILAGELNEETIPQCDLILIVLYPKASMEYLEKIAPMIPSSCMVIDCCGTKEKICALGFSLAERYGFTFVGGHPMAGTQYSGFAHSQIDMFEGASMIVVPPKSDDILLLDRIKKLMQPAGFAHITVTTAEHHDAVIAYTSQMAHLVSNAYVKSPRAQMHKGYSAGSYADLTRVAWLNEGMWTELFLENREHLLEEVDLMIARLQEYRGALEQNDAQELQRLLAEGRICKERSDLP